MIKLTDNELLNLSEAVDVPYDIMQKLYSMHLLHEPMAHHVLMQYEFDKLRKMGKYKTSQIIAALSAKYKVSAQRVREALYIKYHNSYCMECGKRISHREFIKNNGLCNDCMSKNIINVLNE